VVFTRDKRTVCSIVPLTLLERDGSRQAVHISQGLDAPAIVFHRVSFDFYVVGYRHQMAPCGFGSYYALSGDIQTPHQMLVARSAKTLTNKLERISPIRLKR
jgi:hypothetical protein